MRKKETGNDYRYFPEPDIPYLELSDDMISSVKESIVLLPDERRKIYLERNILPINVEKLINNKDLSDYLNNFIETNIDFKIASNLLLTDISSYLNKNRLSIFDTKLSYDKFIELVTLLSGGVITNKIFKDIMLDILETNSSVKEILKEKNISLETDTATLEKIIEKVLLDNEKSVNDYKAGKDNALKFLMGMVMKEVKGSFNPKLVNETLIKMCQKM